MRDGHQLSLAYWISFGLTQESATQHHGTDSDICRATNSARSRFPIFSETNKKGLDPEWIEPSLISFGRCHDNRYLFCSAADADQSQTTYVRYEPTCWTPSKRLSVLMRRSRVVAWTGRDRQVEPRSGTVPIQFFLPMLRAVVGTWAAGHASW